MQEIPVIAPNSPPDFQRIGITAEEIAVAYSVTLRVTPTSLRGH